MKCKCGKDWVINGYCLECFNEKYDKQLSVEDVVKFTPEINSDTTTDMQRAIKVVEPITKLLNISLEDVTRVIKRLTHHPEISPSVAATNIRRVLILCLKNYDTTDFPTKPCRQCGLKDRPQYKGTCNDGHCDNP